MHKDKLYFDSIAEEFESKINPHDLRTRLGWFESAFSEFLDKDSKLASALDVGAGLGQFTAAVAPYAHEITPLDIGPKLVQKLSTRWPLAKCGSATELPFSDESFDVVVSSECIEHTDEPLTAIREMVRVLKPGGYLFLSTPNWLWRWSITVAEALGVRKFAGIENFLRRSEIKREFQSLNVEIHRADGLHILPFQFSPIHPLLRFCDRHAQFLRGLMINQCWVIRKKST